jgi:hypothetical protein
MSVTFNTFSINREYPVGPARVGAYLRGSSYAVAGSTWR